MASVLYIALPTNYKKGDLVIAGLSWLGFFCSNFVSLKIS